MSEKIPTDLIKIVEARRLLEIAPATMTRLLKERRLRTYEDPLDKRVKLVSRGEALALRVPRAEAA